MIEITPEDQKIFSKYNFYPIISVRQANWKKPKFLKPIGLVTEIHYLAEKPKRVDWQNGGELVKYKHQYKRDYEPYLLNSGNPKMQILAKNTALSGGWVINKSDIRTAEGGIPYDFPKKIEFTGKIEKFYKIGLVDTLVFMDKSGGTKTKEFKRKKPLLMIDQEEILLYIWKQ